MDGFAELQQVLASWPTEPPARRFSEACHERLRLALTAWRDDPSALDPGDVAGLVSHCLRREDAVCPGTHLRVPRDGWPEATHWQRAGVEVVATNHSSLLLGRGPEWAPDWLPGSSAHPPLREVFRETVRRLPPDPPIRFDPCVSAVLGSRFEFGRAGAQVEAVRAAFLAPSGSALLVNLPTGTGKSLLGWAPALLGLPARGVSLVITPTVALAIDQEAQVRELLTSAGLPGAEQPLAWHGGLPDEDRALIRRAVRDGRQTILFASPEAVLSSLAPALYVAAETGLLRAFVIDEAHLVAQWGNEFRPEFQAVAGLRRNLLASCPSSARFRTALLTATLTADTFLTLDTLFGPLQMISGAHLRPEPAYWIAHATSGDQKQAWLLEACRQMPRPFLLYVSRRRDAEQWAELLRADGVRRVAHVHGGSADREQTLRNWRAGRLDVVVATSAFGLGVDKADVRAVLHACVPETVDRYYQEVGRGGRDGKACLALLVHDDEDLRISRDLNRERIVTVDLGLQRWQAMHQTAEPATGRDGVLRVRLDARRPGLSGDNDANVAWNLRTLNLMARAGLLTLENERPPEVARENGETEVAFEARRHAAFENYFTQALVRPGEGHLRREVWDVVVEQERQRNFQASRDQLDLLGEVLGQQREFADLFAEVYRITRGVIAVEPELTCGGCPVCRARGDDSLREPVLPVGDPLTEVEVGDRRRLLDLVGGNFAVILYPTPGRSRREQRRWRDLILGELLPRLVARGVGEICVGQHWAAEARYAGLFRFAPSRYVLHRRPDEPDEPAWPLPRLTLLDPADGPCVLSQDLLLLSRPLHLILAPLDVRHPQRPELAYRDLAPTVSLATFFERLSR